MKEEKNIDEFLESVFNELPWSDEALEILMRSEPEHTMPEAMKEKLFSKLSEFQKERARAIEKLAHPEKLNSFGEFIFLIREKIGDEVEEFAENIGVAVSTVLHLEKNDIPIVKMPLDEMKLLIQKLGINIKTAFSLLRKSFMLYGFQPNYFHSMARFDIKKSSETKKIQSMRRVYEEMHLKKMKYKPNKELEDYLASLEDEIRGN